MIINTTDVSGIGAAVRLRRARSGNTPAGLVRPPVAGAMRPGASLVVRRSVVSFNPRGKWTRFVRPGASPRVAASRLAKLRAAKRAVAMQAGRFSRLAGLGDALAGPKRRGVLSRVKKGLKKIKLKTVIKAAAITGAAIALPGAGSVVGTGVRRAASIVAKQAARRASALRSAAKAVRSGARQLVAKKRAADMVKRAIVGARKVNVAKSRLAMNKPTVRAAALLVAGGGAASVLTAAALKKRETQQVPVGAGAGDTEFPNPVSVVSVAPVAANAERQSVDALSPAEREREEQREAAVKQASSELSVATGVRESASVSPFMVAAGLAVAALVLPRVMGSRR